MRWGTRCDGVRDAVAESCERWQKDASGGRKMRAMAERCERWRSDAGDDREEREMRAYSKDKLQFFAYSDQVFATVTYKNFIFVNSEVFFTRYLNVFK